MRDLAEQHVAGVVAEAVVDVLEAVDVEEQHGDAGTVALGPGERVAEELDEQPAVRQPGEQVVVGAVREQVLGRLALDRDRRGLGEHLHDLALARGRLARVVEERDDRAEHAAAVRVEDRRGPHPADAAAAPRRRGGTSVRGSWATSSTTALAPWLTVRPEHVLGPGDRERRGTRRPSSTGTLGPALSRRIWRCWSTRSAPHTAPRTWRSSTSHSAPSVTGSGAPRAIEREHVRLVGDEQLGPGPAGHVAGGHDDPTDRGLVGHVAGDRLDVVPLAVGRLEAEPHRLDGRAGELLAERGGHRVALVGMHARQRVDVAGVALDEAEDLAGGRARVDDVPVGVDDGDHVRQVLHERAEAGVAAAHRLLGLRPAR